MDRQQLLDRLKEVQAELHTSSNIDADEREHLQELASDIVAMLDSEKEAPSPGSSHLINRLEDAALRLEASHPNTTALIGEAVDLLVKLGI